MSTIYTLNGKVLKNSANDKWLKKYVDPYNPLGLPPGTMRFEAPDEWVPSGYDTSSLEFTQVSSSPNIWDMKVLKGYGINNGATVAFTKLLGFNALGLSGYSSGLISRLADAHSSCTEVGPMYLPGFDGPTSGNGLFYNFSECTSIGKLYTPDLTHGQLMFMDCAKLESIPELVTSNVTNMSYMFYGCSSLTSVPLFDTSNVTNMSYMFCNCGSLTSIPLFNTSKVTNMEYTFGNCYKVASGALALYQQASSQTTPPSEHIATFNNCGRDTVTGSAELAQIPSSWGGTGA